MSRPEQTGDREVGPVQIPTEWAWQKAESPLGKQRTITGAKRPGFHVRLE